MLIYDASMDKTDATEDIINKTGPSSTFFNLLIMTMAKTITEQLILTLNISV